MNDHLENDELLKRLRAEDPASDRDDTEAPGEREAVRARVTEQLEADSPPTNRRILRPRLAIPAVLLVLAIGVVLGLTLGGSSPGPAPALAIEKTPKWVTLRLTDPTASDAEMNQELADAGIDRVRVRSVPGAPKGVGTWAGYIEFGPHCQGGVTRFGYDVDIPIARPFNRANRHGAEDEFDLTLPRRSGALISEEVGDPYSKSTVRLPTDSIDDPRNAAKVLVPIRPRSPDDAPDANDVGADQLVELGGVFAQYGEAVEDGHASCADFGLKPYPKPTFPPPGNGWVVVHVTASRGGADKMTREVRSGGIRGKVRQIPAQRQEVDHWLGFARVPALPKHSHGAGNGFGPIGQPGRPADVAGNDVPHVKGPAANDIALRRSAFNAFPNARWIFYVGRAPRPGESAKIVDMHGRLEDAKAAVKRGCPDTVTNVSPIQAGGHKSCGSSPLFQQVPKP